MTNKSSKWHETLVQIFTRTPIVGKVKTRLAKKLGANKACELHRRMTERTIKLVGDLYTLEIWVDGDTKHPFFDQFRGSYNIIQQEGGNLGEKMSYALRTGLIQYKKVLLLGSDCPLIKRETISKASTSLDNFDITFVPVEDGGFSLIGSSKFDGSIFNEINWGSRDVMNRIRRNLQHSSASWNELEMLWDVDEYGDVERLQKETPELTIDLM